MASLPLFRSLMLVLLAVASWSLPAKTPVEWAVPHYDMQVQLDPLNRQLAVQGHLVVGSGPHGILLNPSLRISQLHLNGVDVQATDVQFSAAENRLEFSYSADLADYKGGDLLLSAAGSFLPASSHWYPVLPQVQRLTYSLQLSTVPGQKIVASGRISNEQDSASGYRVSMESDHAIQGLNLYAGPYEISERFWRGRRLRSYFHEDLASLAQGYLRSSEEYLEGYEASLGEFPFSGFFIVSAPFPAGYGYAGLTYIGQRVLRLPFIRSTSLRHEILHNYWGNGVYPDYASGNWAEGLTTYLADYESARQRGQSEAKTMRYQWLRDFAALPPEQDRTARSFVSKEHGASEIIGYHKVAFLFHTLRRELGEDGFDQLLREFWRRHQFKTAGWLQIQEEAERVSGTDLSGIFEQHLDQTGAVELILGNVSAEVSDQEWQVRFSLQQSGTNTALTVPLVIEDINGDRHDMQVDNDGAQKLYSVALETEPVRLAIDPDFHLFRQLTSGEKPPVLRDLFLGSSPRIELASDDKTVAGLVNRLFDQSVVKPAVAQGNESSPLLLIGYTGDVIARLKDLQLGQIPDEVKGSGTAQVWAGRSSGGRAFAVVAARDSEAMRSLYRPLPHYGRQGYLVFEGSRATIKGNWPAEQTLLSYRFNR